MSHRWGWPLSLSKKFLKLLIASTKRMVPTILLVEHANLALQTAQRGYVLETGRIIMEDDAKRLLNNPEIRKAYLGES